MKLKPVYILSKQKDVKEINETEFEKLTTPVESTINADDRVVRRVITNGKPSYVDHVYGVLLDTYQKLGNRAEHQAPISIAFRDGAQYILTFNFDLKKKHVNGSRCIYRAGGRLYFADSTHRTLDSCRNVWYYPLGNNLYLRRQQVALRLGYASTIHGSQGMSCDAIRINLGKSIFCAAQAYVALSRVRTSGGLYIDEFVPKSIRVSDAAKNYMKMLTNKSKIQMMEDSSDNESSDNESESSDEFADMPPLEPADD
jgi:hypothetical protein